MKKIAIFSPAGFGNKASKKYIPALYDLIDALSQDFTITVYTFGFQDKNDQIAACGKAQIIYLNALYSDTLFRKLGSFFIRFYKDHRVQKYQIIHGIWAFPCGFSSVIIGKVLKIRSVVSLQGGEVACFPSIPYGDMVQKKKKWLTLWTCKRVDNLTVLTDFQKNDLQYFGVKRKDIRVIPYGVNRDTFKYSPTPLSVPYGFIHVANLTEVKNQEMLLRAFALIAAQVSCELRIIGPDFLQGKIQKLGRELGLEKHLKFLGYISRKDLPLHLAWAHILLHTSLYEGQAVVVAEAAASGVVVCGTRVGLIADFDDTMALRVESEDYNSLALKVISLLKNRRQFENLQKNAHHWALMHDIFWTAQQYALMYGK